jgi:hypothetical protein
MSFFSKIRGTVETLFSLGGVDGPLWKRVASAIEARDAADTLFAIVRVKTPMGPDDATTKAYVDALAQGLHPHEPVKVVAVTPILLTGLQIIDGISVLAGDRVLVAGQSGSTLVGHIANGYYIAAAGAWARAADMAVGSSAGAAYCLITAGNLYAGTGWVCINIAPLDIVGTNALVFSQFSQDTDRFIQSVFKEITVDTTTTSMVLVPLLSQTITIGVGGILIIHFSTSVSATNAASTMSYRLSIDGVAQRATAQRVAAAGEPQSAALVYRKTGLSAGIHTILIEWNTSQGTARIRPVSNPDSEHCSLLIEEVRA